MHPLYRCGWVVAMSSGWWQGTQGLDVQENYYIRDVKVYGSEQIE